jgi:hypothetical protein
MSDSVESGHCTQCGPGWRLPLLFAVVLAAVLAFQNRGVREPVVRNVLAPPLEHPNGAPRQQVLLTINFGDGRRLENASAGWREGMTVLDLLQNEPRLNLRVQGSGESAFLRELNGVANEGAGGRNWIYSVNGKPADKSCGVYRLRANDHVLWTFAGRQ